MGRCFPRAVPVRPLAGIVLAGVLPLTAPAAVLTGITVDGDMSDWSAVLADSFQSAQDGPAGGLADLDAPIQSTGRDLSRFAWTYDGGYFYLYVGREASTSNVQLFWYYIDVDGDGRMESGEPVIGVNWKGSNRSTITSHYTYLAASAGGDSLGDPAGYADGFTMPGTIRQVAELERGSGGAANGIEMEARVSWSVLGVPAGSPMRFHVSSSNSPNVPWQIDDNMGGPGGRIGTTVFPGPTMTVVKTADRAAAAPGEVITYTVVYTSTGGADAFNVAVTDAVPAETAYVSGSAVGAGASIEFSHDGGLSYDASEAAPVTHLRWRLPAPLAPGDSGSVSFQVAVR